MMGVAVVLATLMAFAAAAGILVRPSVKATDGHPKRLLEDVVPKQFGDWREIGRAHV